MSRVPPGDSTVAVESGAAAQTTKAVRSAAVDASVVPPVQLPPYKPPKQFIDARAVRAFVIAGVVAGGFAAAIYVALATNLDRGVERRKALLKHLRPPAAGDDAKPISGDEARHAATKNPLPVFKAPSSFQQLLAEHELVDKTPVSDATARKGDAVDAAGAPHRPLLHEEAMLRAKRAWNDSVDAMQATVLEAIATRQRRRRDRAMAAIRAAVADAASIDVVNASIELREA